MFQTLILILLSVASVGAWASEPPRWGLGLAFESRYQRDVNPDFGGMRNIPAEYVKVLLWPWAVVLEADQEQRTSTAGSLSVQNRSIGVGLWGHYEFKPPGWWAPYLGVGVGTHMDDVQTRFENSFDERGGRRDFAGLAAGITSTLWNNVLLEAEGRVALVQDDKDPEFSALFRMGVEM